MIENKASLKGFKNVRTFASNLRVFKCLMSLMVRKVCRVITSVTIKREFSFETRLTAHPIANKVFNDFYANELFLYDY